MSDRVDSRRIVRRGGPAVLGAMLMVACAGAPIPDTAYPAQPDAHTAEPDARGPAHGGHGARVDGELVVQPLRGSPRGGVDAAHGLFASPDDRRRQGHGSAPAVPRGPFRVPPPASPDDVLVVRVSTSLPYIDNVATRVAYDGMDNMFIIDWRADGKSGQVWVPHRLFTAQKVIADVLEDPRAGVAVPARYTPYMVPRLWPYMVPRLWPYMKAARAKWARQFDEMAFASTGMLATATIMTLRPITAPAVAPALTTAANTRAGLATSSRPAPPATRTGARSTPNRVSANAAGELPRSGPIARSLGAMSRAERLARKLNMNVDSPTTRQVLNSLEDRVSDFVGRFRRGSILRELPSEVLDLSVEQAIRHSPKVRKLLTSGRFAK